MKTNRLDSRFIAVTGFNLIIALCGQSQTLPFVSPIFGDNMVLQRDKTNTIWGWARPDEKISVNLADRTATAKSGADGRWQVQLPPLAAGGPHTLNIVGATKVSFTNILVGDIWLCGGQSNMEWPLGLARNGAQAVSNASHANLRLFTVRQHPAYAPAAIVSGSWKICSPKTATEDGGVSAVGYYFARKVQSETNVPVGLIKDCWGGTPAESWASPEALGQLKDFDAALKEVERLRARGGSEYGNYISHWYEEFDAGQKNNWAAPGHDESDWKAVTIPGGFRELGVAGAPAVCYFRKTITLPDPLPAGSARILLGVIERMDTTHINGRWVGASAWVENPRAYTIGTGILQPGKNVVTVRVFKTKPDGGFQSKPEQLKLVLGDKTEIPLAGEWLGKVSVNAQPPHPLPLGFENWPTMPGVLHRGMIAPVAPLALSGALWYQGESNVGRAAQYRVLLPTLIADWRKTFAQGDFPFYIVSLAAYQPRKDAPGDDAWAELREAQAFAACTVPNSGLALAIDVGNASDVHPIDKREVGERLALCALANHYGRKVVFAGPTFDRAEEISGALKLHFKNADGGLVVKGDKLGEFAIAGVDRQWVWADARIEGDTILVSSPRVAQPRFARYAWQANPLATLFNSAGLPAVPFRTDVPEK
jgi:sialate O-acetylesterase